MTRAAAGAAIVGLWFGLAASCTAYDIKEGTGGAGAAGSSGTGGAGGVGGSNTGGGPQSCEQDKDCARGPCQTATCVEGACKVEGFTDLETDQKPDARGDCKKLVCENGVLAVAENAADPPDDGNDCTTDKCDGTTPVYEPVLPGKPCTNGSYCYVNIDTKAAFCAECGSELNCTAELCVSGKCTPPHCTDAKFSADNETDLDCGKECRPCTPGKKCMTNEDCDSKICSGGFCAAPSCTDGLLNGTETYPDCGASCPTKCPPGYACLQDADCASQQCYGGYCYTSTCKDNRINGSETDVDCGGDCPPCPAP